MLILTFCTGILAPSPGCREDRVRLLADITPQQCVLHAQQKAATESLLFAGRVVRYRCERRGRV